MEKTGGEEESSSSNDVAPALLSLHPRNTHVVVAVGSELRVFNLQVECAVVLENTTESSGHQGAIKAIRFNKEGDLFVSTGDDKLVKLWNTNSWLCLKTVQTNKKVSAASFSHDSRCLLFADKFGVVYTIPTRSAEELDAPVQLLAHCCSIITSLDCCVEGRFIITSDRDFKIRVSLYPKDPLKGAHEIQGFCLGHTSFVSCMALSSNNSTTQFLVSGGGDGTVRLWEIKTSSLLNTFHLGDVADLLDTAKNEDEEHAPAITCIAVSKNGSLVAVGVESLDGVLFLGCDFQLKKMSFLQKINLGESFFPTSIQFDGRGWLWMVAGAAEKLGAGEQRAVTWVKVISTTNEPTFEVMKDNSLPGGALLFETLEGDASKSDRTSTLADAANATIKSNLSKRHYSLEYREIRKQMRNDRKLQRDICRV